MDKEAILNREKHGRRNDLRRAYNQKKSLRCFLAVEN